MRLKPTLLAAAIVLSSAALSLADVSGTYTWTAGGMGGGGGGGGGNGGGGGGGGGNNETTLVLKQDGDKLTGSITGGRGGEQQISDGTVSGNDIKFNVVREFNGNKFVTGYAGTVDGDTIKLKITTTREVEAKKKTM